MDQPLYSIDFGDDYLEHHGVKGMKWGQHLFGRDRRGGSRTQSVNPHSFEAYARRSKATANLDDDTLRRIVQRKRSENQFRNLSVPSNSRGYKSISNGLGIARMAGGAAGAGMKAFAKTVKRSNPELSSAMDAAGKLVSNLSDKTSKLDNAIKTSDARAQKREKKKIDLSRVSDEDLRKAIDRKTLEQDYSRLSNEYSESGMSIVNEMKNYYDLGLDVSNTVRAYRTGSKAESEDDNDFSGNKPKKKKKG